MNSIRFLATVICLVSAGCSTPNVNPLAPRANTGYVDFYADSSLELSWEVKRGSENTGEMRTVFSELKPIEGTVLRLAAPPGRHRFQVWFMNQFTEGPQIVSVDVMDAKVTPIHVTLTLTGSAAVDRKVYGFRPSAKGYGRGTKIVTEQNESFQIGAVAETPREYRPKEQMPYFSSQSK